MSPLGAGVVGLGTKGRNHVRVLGDLPGVELVGATDPDPRARHAARAISVAPDLDTLRFPASSQSCASWHCWAPFRWCMTRSIATPSSASLIRSVITWASRATR